MPTKGPQMLMTGVRVISSLICVLLWADLVLVFTHTYCNKQSLLRGWVCAMCLHRAWRILTRLRLTLIYSNNYLSQFLHLYPPKTFLFNSALINFIYTVKHCKHNTVLMDLSLEWTSFHPLIHPSITAWPSIHQIVLNPFFIFPSLQ